MQTDPIDRALLYSIWAGFFLLLFMPLIVTPQAIFPFIVGKAVYGRIVIALVFGLWAVLAFRNASFRPPRSRLVVILGIYLFISLLAGIFGVSFQRSLWSTFERMQGIVDLAHWIALVVVLSSVIRNNTNWYYLLNANMGISLIVALIGLSQGVEGQGLPFYRFLQEENRIGITLGNPAFVGTYMMLNAIIGLGLLLRSIWPAEEQPPPSQARGRRTRRRRREDTVNVTPYLWRGFWVIVVILDLWAMTLTGTRGAVIALIAGIVVFSVGYILVGRRTVMKRSMTVLVVSMLLLGILVIVLRNTPFVKAVASNNVLIQRMTDLRPDQDPFTSRLFAFTVGYRSIVEKPILGWGPENYIVPFGRYYVEGTSNLEILDQAHNKPIEELVTKGILGLASYLAIWFVIFRALYHGARRSGQRDQIFVLTIASALAAYFVQNLFLFDTPTSSLQFIILAAIVVNVDGTNRPMPPERSNLDASKSVMGTRKFSHRVFGAAKHEVRAIRSSLVVASNLRIAGLVITFTLVMLSLWLNIRAYSAATAIIEVTRGVSSLDVALATVNRSISTFPPLANYPRLIYFRNVGAIWPDLSEADAQRVLEFADKKANDAIAAEPQNWRVYVTIAEMYRDIASQRLGFEGVDSARHYLNIAVGLAPERSEVVRLRQQVEALESQRDASPKH